MLIVGVDGCRGGWIAVVWKTETTQWEPRRHADFSEIVACYRDAACIGIDIPIGLRNDGRPRGCDVAARALLGWPRGSSVFPAPQRRLLDCDAYAEALAHSREAFGRGISRQAFGIYCKVREVDREMTPELQHQVIEVHPEVAFWAMNDGQPMAHSKKRAAGFEARRDALRRSLPLDIPDTPSVAKALAPYAGADDLLDALAVAWTARRHAACGASRLFAEPSIDDDGLRMEIVC
jgi:predicted RNase H-like nuclease